MSAANINLPRTLRVGAGAGGQLVAALVDYELTLTICPVASPRKPDAGEIVELYRRVWSV